MTMNIYGPRAERQYFVNINFGMVHNKEEAIEKLRELSAEIGRATKDGALDETAENVKSKVDEATSQAQKPGVDKDAILDVLNGAEKLVRVGAALPALIEGLRKAAEMVSKYF